MNKSEYKKAVWRPSWYEMDQSIAVGSDSRFCFYQDSRGQGLDEEIDFSFFNQLDSDANSETRFATVAGICHSVLGPLSRVDTDGLDYIFTLLDGTDVVVNAEEEPGKSYDDGIEIEDWSVVVSLVNVSEPLGDVV